jgi:hypothetical protein
MVYLLKKYVQDASLYDEYKQLAEYRLYIWWTCIISFKKAVIALIFWGEGMLIVIPVKTIFITVINFLVILE